MRTLIDHTFIHQVNRLFTEEHLCWQPIQALSLFHLIEHILFSESIVVATGPHNSEFVVEFTSEALNQWFRQGIIPSNSEISLVKMEEFTTNEVILACKDASSRMLSDLEVFDSDTLHVIGECAASIDLPYGSTPFKLDSYSHASSSKPLETDNKITGWPWAATFMLESNPGLRERLDRIREGNPNFSIVENNALNLMMRSNLYCSMASSRQYVYAPAPARCQLATIADNLFRHKVEGAISTALASTGRSSLYVPFRDLREIESLPLPYITMYLLRNIRASSPTSLIEAVSRLREEPEVLEIRRLLLEWESRQQSPDFKERVKATRELQLIAADLVRHMRWLDGAELSSTARIGIEIEPNPELGSFSIQFNVGSIVQSLNNWVRRFQRRRIFYAAVGEYAKTTDLGARLVQLIGRSLR